MANKIVNATKLDAALSATADAIRAKTGDSAEIEFDLDTETGFESAVEAIPSGEDRLAPFIQNTSCEVTSEDFEGITSISNYAFYHKTNMSGEVALPDTLTSIGEYAFNNCTKLKITSLGSTTSIGAHAFEGCTSLELAELPSGITTLNSTVFTGCTKLALTSLPDTITTIGNKCFQNCTHLALTSLPSALVSVSTNVFENCTNVNISEIPASVTTLDSRSMAHIGSTSITFLGKPTKMGTTTFTNNPQLTLLRVPWSEGEVAGAPWGATNAEIVYNYVPITDLTGHTWYANDTISLPYDAVYNVQNRYDVGFPFFVTEPYLVMVKDTSFDVDSGTTTPRDNPCYTPTNGWREAGMKTVYFKSSDAGTDATNPELIAWLEANGTIT